MDIQMFLNTMVYIVIHRVFLLNFPLFFLFFPPLFTNLFFLSTHAFLNHNFSFRDVVDFKSLEHISNHAFLHHNVLYRPVIDFKSLDHVLSLS